MTLFHRATAPLKALLLPVLLAGNLCLADAAPRTVDWTELMPEEDLQLLMNMPAVDHEGLSDDELMQDTTATTLKSPTSSFEDEVANAIGQAIQAGQSQERTWQDALVSTRVRPELDNTNIRLAGYIVPIDFDDNDVITSFFLVPYFGACIHVPPPPPNQIIYVRYAKGFTLENLYTPFWISGKLKVETIENDMALASYSLDASQLVEYQEGDIPEPQ
ncbi:DUF3299 domain-containing protein [Cellvibrio polysaccharolyticus]|uniref:DUF3299 domain-containing protein n=1 Tax=Cellvibrio polysaccharolyticus TaxID=2082724 RepID=UPI00193239D2|nr:DUF3299 domain-containing protein [Cellvibrio polysaccharolyticus]